MLNCCVTDTKETPFASKTLDDLGKVGQRTGQAVDLVADDDIDAAALDVREKLLQGGAVHRRTGDTAIVIGLREAGPALMALARDVGLASLALGM